MKRAKKSAPPPPESGLRKMSRRGFIASGATVGAAAAGIAIGGPLLHLGGASLAGADLGGAVSARKNAGPVVAYIHDPASGRLEVLVGNTGVTVTDKDLVARLVRAAG